MIYLLLNLKPKKFVKIKNVKIPELVSKYYSFPFKYDGYSYIWDNDHNMCLMKVHGDDNFINSLVDNLNGTQSQLSKEKEEFIIKDGKISTNEKTVLIIRGWGRLQYITEDKPELIQDTFGQWIVDVLNNKK